MAHKKVNFKNRIRFAKRTFSGLQLHRLDRSHAPGMCPVKGEKPLCAGGAESFGVSFPVAGGKQNEVASAVFVQCQNDASRWHIWFLGRVDDEVKKLRILGEVFESPTMTAVTIDSGIDQMVLHRFFRALAEGIVATPAPALTPV